ncbi:hypothetical protein LIA77_07545 [Sarocladium implicatum]|nr:hypothetical protein LIA77_07545 [Sarocladium implicatum]
MAPNNYGETQASSAAAQPRPKPTIDHLTRRESDQRHENRVALTNLSFVRQVPHLFESPKPQSNASCDEDNLVEASIGEASRERGFHHALNLLSAYLLTAWICAKERHSKETSATGEHDEKGTADHSVNEPLVTLEDAVASSLKRPDRATGIRDRGRGAETQGDTESQGQNCTQSSAATQRLQQNPGYVCNKETWDAAHRQRWFLVHSIIVWLQVIIPYTYRIALAAIIVVIVLCLTTASIVRNGGQLAMDRDIDRLRKHEGFGTFPGLPLSFDQSFVAQVLFANLFQLLIRLLYVLYNGLLTRLLVGAEFLRFLKEKKTLRLSSPSIRAQRSSYMLSLPLNFAAPLMIACALVH